MYETVIDFLRTFNADNSVLWALLVLAVISGTSLVLFVFWERVLGLLFAGGPFNKTGRRRIR